MARKILTVDAGMKCLTKTHIAPKNPHKIAKKTSSKKSKIVQEIGLSSQDKRNRTRKIRVSSTIKNQCNNPEAIDCLISVEETAENTCNLLKNMLRNYERRNIGNKDIKYFTRYKISPLRYATDLLLQRQYTDDEMITELKKYYHNEDTANLNLYLKTARTLLNRGRLHTPRKNGLLSAHIGVIKDNANNRVILPYCPKDTRKKQKKIFDLQVV